MNSAPNASNTLRLLLPVLGLALVPVALYLVMIPIAYYRRKRQLKANPQMSFDKSLLRAAFDLFGMVFLGLVVLSFFFHFEDNQLQFGPQVGFLQDLWRNPVLLVGGLAVISVLFTVGFISYLVAVIKPQVYRGDYERALKFVRGWKWLPVFHNLIVNLEGSILLFSGDYAKAEQCFRDVEKRGKKGERTTRGSNLGNLGWSLLRQGRYQEALNVLETSIAEYPEGADNFNGLGEVFLWLGNAPDKALEYLDRGIDNKRFRMTVDQYVWGELLANKAWALAQSGSRAEALKLFQQALDEAEQGCIPALAGLHLRGAQIMRLCGNEAQAGEELKLAVQLDPKGGYGQMAKAALESEREQPGLAQLAIKADAAAVVRAIQQVTPATRQIRVIRENVLMVAKGTPYSYLYLLRAQPEGSTLAQVIVHITPAVEAALANPDLKTALQNLINAAKSSSVDSTLPKQHLQTIAKAASTPQINNKPESAPAEAKASAALTGTNSFDPAEVFARKPLPKVTAKDRPSGGGLGPSWFAGMSFIMTPVVSGLIMSYFWRRVGKPSWMWLSMLLAILVPVVAFGSAILLLRVIPLGVGQFLVLMGAAGVSYGFVFALSSLLEGAYQTWHREGTEAAANYPYNWTRAALIGGGVFAGALALGSVIYFTRPGPQTFNHPRIAVTYPAGWKVGDLTQVKDCKTDSECFVLLYEGQFGYSGVLIGRFRLTDPAPSASVERTTWINLQQQNAGIVLESRDSLQVGGLDAARRFYFSPPAQSSQSSDMEYVMQIYIVRGQDAYFVSAWGKTKPIFEENRAAIDSIVNSLVLKGESF